jgi:uncharacterized FlaG/YvyC family protein
MATISKIASLSEAPAAGSKPSAERTQRADAELHQVKRQTAPPRPKGVREVINQQRDNELDNPAPPKKNLRELVRGLQESIDRATKDQYEVGFRQDSSTGTSIIEIKDKEGHLIKQFPPEKVLNLQRKMDELSGMVIDEMI